MLLFLQFSTMYRIIDWNELWKVYHASSPERIARDRDPASVWDLRAASYRKFTRDATALAEKEVGMVNLRPNDTVLDVGAGGGRLAVPIAKKVAHVTALDPSGAMLSLLREHMGETRQENFSCLQIRWEDVEVAVDLLPHDVVIDSFTLGFYDLKEALQKLDAAALRAVYLFWHAGEWRSAQELLLYRTVFGEAAVQAWGYPDYIYVVNILHDLGIFANMRIYEATWETVYESPAEAAEHWARMHDVSPDHFPTLQEHFAKILVRQEDGRYLDSVSRLQAMIWWTKEEIARD
jgi:SAM-dependent methyltransferase